VMLLGPVLFSIDAATQAKLLSLDITFGTMGTLADVINMGVRIALTVVVITELIDAGKLVYRMLKVRIPELA